MISKNLIIKVVSHGIIGCIAGYLFLHPASMLIHHFHHISHLDLSHILAVIKESFSTGHFTMALYFTALGLLSGILHGLYASRLETLSQTVERLSISDLLDKVSHQLFQPGFQYRSGKMKDGTEAVSVKVDEWISGIPASPGVATGLLCIIDEEDSFISLFEKPIVDDRPLERFQEALEETEIQLHSLYEQAMKDTSEDAAKIFDAHLLILQDNQFIQPIRNLINGGDTINKAVLRVTSQYIEDFSNSDNFYIQEKVQDLKDVVMRIMNNLLQDSLQPSIKKDSIVIAKELYPSDLLKLASEKVKGIILTQGGVTSHISILARSLRIPLIIVDRINPSGDLNGQSVLIDTFTSRICLNPSTDTLSSYNEKIVVKTMVPEKRERKSPVDLIATSDGTPVTLSATINLLSDFNSGNISDFNDVGLYRTEFAFLNSGTFPTEEEQFTTYRKVIEKAEGKTVTFRTFDFGGDKIISIIRKPQCNNPMLSLKSTRFLLKNSEMFSAQIRAILRAGAHSSICIMFPMISSLDEFIEARNLVEKCVEQFRENDRALPEKLHIGILLEMPSVVEIIDELSDAADFLSLGTNDFIQYMLAVDRGNAELTDFYLPHHPSILRALKRISDSAAAADKPLAICGDMARDALYLPYLIGIGIRQFSIETTGFADMRKEISRIDLNEAQAFAEHLSSQGKIIDIRSIISTQSKRTLKNTPVVMG